MLELECFSINGKPIYKAWPNNGKQLLEFIHYDSLQPGANEWHYRIRIKK